MLHPAIPNGLNAPSGRLNAPSGRHEAPKGGWRGAFGIMFTKFRQAVLAGLAVLAVLRSLAFALETIIILANFSARALALLAKLIFWIRIACALVLVVLALPHIGTP